MIRYCGLDVETTGTGLDGNYVIQLGLAAQIEQGGDPLRFTADVRPMFPWLLSDGARKVNGFTEDRVERAKFSYEVDRNMHGFLKIHGVTDGSLIAVGWNVGSFDLALAKKDLPLLASLFHYRSLDLNSMCFMLAGDDDQTFEAVKRRAKEYAAAATKKNTGVEMKEHDACHDAYASLLAAEWLMSFEHPLPR